jgi:hypothetical protein
MTRDGNTLVLALATLCGKTLNRNDPICVAPPKVAKASTIATVTCRCCWRYHLKNIANVNTALNGVYTMA